MAYGMAGMPGNRYRAGLPRGMGGFPAVGGGLGGLPVRKAVNAPILFPDTVLLLNCNGTNGSTIFTDSSPYARTVTATNATIDTSVKKYGTASGNFQVTRYLSTPGSSKFIVGVTETATIEFWVRAASASAGYYYLTDSGAGNLSAIALTFNDSNAGAFVVYTSGYIVNVSGLSSLTTGAWHHIALVLTPNAYAAYINGTSIASGARTIAYGASASDTFYISRYGAYPDNNNLVGYLDDFRFVRNVAVYTGAFTPPTSELTVL